MNISFRDILWNLYKHSKFDPDNQIDMIYLLIEKPACQ